MDAVIIPQVKHPPRLSPARVTGSVRRGSPCDVDVTDGALCHLWGKELTKCGHDVMMGLKFSNVWVRFSASQLSCQHNPRRDASRHKRRQTVISLYLTTVKPDPQFHSAGATVRSVNTPRLLEL